MDFSKSSAPRGSAICGLRSDPFSTAQEAKDLGLSRELGKELHRRWSERASHRPHRPHRLTADVTAEWRKTEPRSRERPVAGHSRRVFGRVVSEEKTKKTCQGRAHVCTGGEFEGEKCQQLESCSCWTLCSGRRFNVCTHGRMKVANVLTFRTQVRVCGTVCVRKNTSVKVPIQLIY